MPQLPLWTDPALYIIIFRLRGRWLPPRHTPTRALGPRKQKQSQENIKKWICLIYDPVRSGQGAVALKALKLQDKFIAAYKEDGLTMEKMAKSGISWDDIFLEIPVTIANSVLTRALVGELTTTAAASQGDYDRLGLSTNPFLEKNLEFLVEVRFFSFFFLLCRSPLSHAVSADLGRPCPARCRAPPVRGRRAAGAAEVGLLPAQSGAAAAAAAAMGASALMLGVTFSVLLNGF